MAMPRRKYSTPSVRSSRIRPKGKPWSGGPDLAGREFLLGRGKDQEERRRCSADGRTRHSFVARLGRRMLAMHACIQLRTRPFVSHRSSTTFPSRTTPLWFHPLFPFNGIHLQPETYPMESPFPSIRWESRISQLEGKETKNRGAARQVPTRAPSTR